MEDPEAELLAMVAYLRQHHELVPQVAGIEFVPGTDVATAREDLYRQLAGAWKHHLRRDPAYLAWRRRADPAYQPPDEPDPNAWENLTDAQKFERRRAERFMERLEAAYATMTPEQRRVVTYIHTRQTKMVDVYRRLHEAAEGGDERVRAIAEATREGLALLDDMIRVLAIGAAMIPPGAEEE